MELKEFLALATINPKAMQKIFKLAHFTEASTEDVFKLRNEVNDNFFGYVRTCCNEIRTKGNA